MENADDFRNSEETGEITTENWTTPEIPEVEAAVDEPEEESLVVAIAEETSLEEISEGDNDKRLNKMKKKKLCELVKNNSLKKHPDEYQALVSNATYVCLKCGRTAKEKSSLCKPMLMTTSQK